MPLKRLLVVAVAALGLCLSGYAVSAGSAAESGAASIDQPTVVNSKSTFTLVKGGKGGGRGMGARRMGGRSMAMRGGRGFRGGRGRGFRRGFGGGWDGGYDCVWPFPSPYCWY
jgi:hypothetical protein